MKTVVTIFAITLVVCTAGASEPVPYIAMPVDNGYAIDAYGKRQPNALCARDIIWACAPRYPLRARSSDPTTWSRNAQGDGLFRLDINLKTGRVSHEFLASERTCHIEQNHFVIAPFLGVGGGTGLGFPAHAYAYWSHRSHYEHRQPGISGVQNA